MSSDYSSPEDRPFITHPSPLYSSADEATGRPRHTHHHFDIARSNHSGNLSPGIPEIRVVQPPPDGLDYDYSTAYEYPPSPLPVIESRQHTSNPVSAAPAGTRQQASAPSRRQDSQEPLLDTGIEQRGSQRRRPQNYPQPHPPPPPRSPQWSSRNGGGSGSRRRRSGSEGPPNQRIGGTGHRASFGHFQAAGLDNLLENPSDLGSTFEPGSFQPGIRAQTPRAQAESILDRSPTVRYAQEEEEVSPTDRSRSRIDLDDVSGIARFGSRRSKKTVPERESQVNANDGAASKREIETELEKMLGISVKDPNTAVAKTFVRPEMPTDLLDYPVIHNPRVTLHLAITQPLYSGGGCVVGRLDIHVRGTRLDDIRLGRVSIDICGVEELSFSRKAMFMNFASELIDEDHPPPAAMLKPADNDDKFFWKIKPSRSFVPFRLDVPLNVGPGPFHSVRAKIRYVIHGTVMLTVNGHKTLVRCSRDIRIISALDPETALLPLEQPLLSTEEHHLRWGGHDTVKVTAGIHRAVWVAGTAAYVDVNVINNTQRKISSIKCKLRRYILAYKESVAMAEGQSAGHLRVPSWKEKKTLSHSELNMGSRWKGVKESQLDVVTCEIDIPRNELTVKMGRFFEVKYLIDIAVCSFAARPVRVQVPITVVHMNSLDILPNDLRDVSLAINDRYPRHQAKIPLPGRAFAAPRERALIKTLQEPLLPSQAPLQPRKATPRAGAQERPLSRSRSRGRERDVAPPVRVDFDTGVFGPGGLPDPRTATPEVQKMIWDDQGQQVDLARRRSTVVSRGSRTRMRSRERPRSRSREARRTARMDGSAEEVYEMSNMELLKQLASLKEA